MQEELNDKSVSKFIRNLCRGKSKVELLEAEENFLAYLMVVKEIADRLDMESQGLQIFDQSIVMD